PGGQAGRPGRQQRADREGGRDRHGRPQEAVPAPERRLMPERCAECGYAYDVAASAFASRLAAYADRYAAALAARTDTALRTRPDPPTRSGLGDTRAST